MANNAMRLRFRNKVRLMVVPNKDGNVDFFKNVILGDPYKGVIVQL
jgi:hypothetical protein